MNSSIGALLQEGTATLRSEGVEPARLEAELLLAQALGLDRVGLLTARDECPDEEGKRRFQRYLARRLRREPNAYIRGEREFWSRPFWVNPFVLIPRQDTETLVAESVALMEGMGPRGLAVEVGVGSGNVVVSLAVEHPDWRFVGIDISRNALKVARSNAARHDVEDRIDWVQADLTTFLLPRARTVDLVVSNPPYVAEADLRELDREIRDFEPRVALEGGPTGLSFISRLLEDAPRIARPGGAVLLEIGADQGDRVVDWVERSRHYRRWRLVQDLCGRDRVLCAEVF